MKKGQKMSEEQKRKIGEANRNRPEARKKAKETWVKNRLEKGLPVPYVNTFPPDCACGCGKKVDYSGHGKVWNTYYSSPCARRGKKNSKEHNEAIGRANRGRKYNIDPEIEKERRKKISKAFKGRKQTQENKDRISETLKKKYAEDEKYAEKMRLGREKAKKKRDEYWKEPKNREEHKKRMRESGLKRRGKHSSWCKGITKYDHLALMERSNKMKEFFANGGKPHNWNGGSSLDPYSNEFDNGLKTVIRRRDNFRCCFCGAEKNNRALSVHHIDYDKNNFEFVNLITLCDSCHGKTNSNPRSPWIFICRYIVKEPRSYLIQSFKNSLVDVPKFNEII